MYTQIIHILLENSRCCHRPECTLAVRWIQEHCWAHECIVILLVAWERWIERKRGLDTRNIWKEIINSRLSSPRIHYVLILSTWLVPDRNWYKSPAELHTIAHREIHKIQSRLLREIHIWYKIIWLFTPTISQIDKWTLFCRQKILPPWETGKQSMISFKFRTNEPNGLILLSSGTKPGNVS